MKRFIVFIVLNFSLISVHNVFAQEIDLGSTAHIPEWDKVKVVNSEEISNDSNFNFEYQEPCVIHRTGIIEVKKRKGFKLLVEYSIEGRNYLSSCPSGTLFYITEEEFDKMKERYLETRDKLDVMW